jgi:3-hydroxybutyryl-CoA dehydrogenase
MSSEPLTVGVIGAGTMGRGIAQAAARAGRTVRLVDPDAAARASASEMIARDLGDAVRRRRVDEAGAAAARRAIELVERSEQLAGCALVIEAVPEQLELKRAVLADAESATDPGAVLATNTSSLSVSALARGLAAPQRLVGMHFFNPAHVLPLVEIVAGLDTDPSALALAASEAASWGKQPVTATDRPGFIVNRCARPLYGEADRLLQERIGTPAQIDEIMRTAGFRMGPFELADLIGLDTNLDVQRSFWDQSHEPRWRPAAEQQRLVAAGRLGRKSGRGFHAYPEGPERGAVTAPSSGPGELVRVTGTTRLARELRDRFGAVGLLAAAEPAEVQIDAGLDPAPRAADVHAVLCWRRSLAAGPPGAVGFSTLPPLDAGPAVELTATPATPPAHLARAQAAFARAGLPTTVVGDGPGLVLTRMVAQLVNEAAFALQEGVADAGAIDRAMLLGLRFPRGPVAWSDHIGLDVVLAVLDGLFDENREERYRAAPTLRRAVARGASSLAMLDLSQPSQQERT